MKKEFIFIVILLSVASFLFFFKLGDMALTDPDETFYAQTAKEMLNRADYLTPFIFGKPQFEKPIFYYWLELVSFKFFGVGEFAARFPSALFGIAGIIGVYFLGRVFFSSLCGFLSALILATCTQYVILARACVTDMVLLVFILFCLLFFVLGWTRDKNFYYLFSAVFAAFGVLTKGPIGLFIPIATTIVYIVLSRQWKDLRKVPLAKSLLLFSIICLPWYIAAIKNYGGVFIEEFFGVHNITRFLKPEHAIGSAPFFYVPVIIGGFFPWIFFFFAGVSDMFKNKGMPAQVKAPGMFLSVWFLLVFLFFSFSSTKLVTYIFPLFPVMAVVTGRFWERVISKDGKRSDDYGKIAYWSLVIFSLPALVLIYFLVKHKYSAVSGDILCAGVIFVTGLILSLILFLRGNKIFSFFSIILFVMFLFIQIAMRVLPAIGEYESSRALACKLKELSKEGEAVAGESDHRRGIAFYSDRVFVKDIHPYSERISFFSQNEKRVWAILQRKHYNQVKQVNPEYVSEPLFESGKYVLVRNKA